jgi:tetratricopeptide (TPR) repeat protein
MELLIKKIKLNFLFILLSVFVFGQDSNTLINAYNQSLSLEAAYKYQEAINLMQSQYDAKNYEITIRLAWLNYLNGDFATSINQYKTAIELKPQAIEPRIGIIYPYAFMQNTEAIILEYKEILKLDPNNTSVLYKLGTIYYNRLQFNEALIYFDKILKLFPSDYNTLLMSGWTNLKLGNKQEALKQFNNVLMISYNDSSALEGLSSLK